MSDTTLPDPSPLVGNVEMSVTKLGQGELVPQARGGALKRGNPGNKGGGRPPNEWKAAMRYLASRGATLKRAKEILEKADDGALWAQVWKFAGEQGYGRAHQTISKATVSRVEFALVDERVARPPASDEPEADGESE